METDKRYFLEGLFIVVFTVAAAVAFAWLAKSGHRDDITYRIRFAESVSGLAVGDPVKFHGVDVGTVKAMEIDRDDPQRTRVDVRLRREAPVKTDTHATLKLKGITGVVLVELDGGSAGAKRLVDVTPAGAVPEIPSEKGPLTTLLEDLPKVMERIASIGSKTEKVLSDVGVAAKNAKETSREVKEDPTLLLRRRPKKD